MNQSPAPGVAEPASSVDPDEVARFAALSAEWWDVRGGFAPLHAMNPVRLAFIRGQALAHFGRDGPSRTPFAGLRLLDVGCGGGLICEPMARLGFDVVGADPAEDNIAVARSHAGAGGLAIDYRAAAVETFLAAAEPAFDVVLALEVVEHVRAPAAFLADCARLLAPGGLMVVSTLNRTLRSLALGKIAAEYVLRWAPAGTHDWRRFVTPGELSALLAGPGRRVDGPFGLAFDPLAGRWTLSRDCAVNYFMTMVTAPA